MNTSPLTRDNILNYAEEQFDGKPEYLWARTPDCAVLRHPDNRKWYAVIMEVERARLGLPGEGPADILTLKCDPVLVGVLRKREGFLPAYHMNREQWITLLLDGSVSCGEGFQLLEMSFELTRKKLKKAPQKEQQESGGIHS